MPITTLDGFVIQNSGFSQVAIDSLYGRAERSGKLDLFHAWVRGKTLQYRNDDHGWRDLATVDNGKGEPPYFNLTTEYRVKERPVPRMEPSFML